jgi:subtilase family serine protease
LLGAVVLAAGTAVVAFAVPGAAGAASKTAVYVPKSLCSTPVAGHASCFAQKLVKKLVNNPGNLPAAARVRPNFGNGPAGGYSPGEVAKAYGINPGAATTQTVAIVDAFRDPSVRADLNAFDDNYGLPHETTTTLQVVSQTGGSVAAVPTDVGWAGEISLDVQAVRGLCHKCKILLVETDSDDMTDLAAGVNYAAAHAKIVSNSYGTPETGANTPGIRSAFNHHGVAVLASSGDDGWYGWNATNAGCPSVCTSAPSDDMPSAPASFNTVVGVGGTALYLTPSSTRAAEQVWNDNGAGDIFGFQLGMTGSAAGSGCSLLFNAQGWQSHVAGYTGLGCGAAKRSGVDIAAIADPFTGYDIFQSTLSWCPSGNTDGNGNNCPTQDPNWAPVGGTSLASPVIAAMWALAGGPGGVTYPALSLYGHFKSGGSTYDVTVGGNGYCGTATPGFCNGGFNPNAFIPGQDVDCGWSITNLASNAYLTNRYQCYARPGYDGVAGVGTPKGLAVFKPMSPTARISFSGTITHGISKSFSGAASSDPFPGGAITSYSWNWGDGSGTGSSSVTVTHKYATKGTKTITLTVTDNYGRKGTKKITVTVT